MTDAAEIYATVDELEAEIIEFLGDFLAIPTVNPPGINYPEGADFLVSALENLGYRSERITVPTSVVAEHYPDRSEHERVNVLGRKDPDRDGPNLHFTGHFDVVPVGEDWTKDPFDPVVEDGRVFGRGASDMKSGIVASLFAIEALERAGVPLSGTITQSMTVDEETGGFTGLGYLVETGHVTAENTDYCVYTECFDSSRIALGHRGVLKGSVVAHGSQAHGCMAHEGKNAVMALNDFLTRVGEYRETLHGRVTDLPVTPEPSKRADIAVTMVDGGYSENIVPDRASVTFYRTVLPEESIEQARAEIRDLMDASARATGANFEYEEIMYAEPTAVPADCHIARVFEEEILSFHEETSPVFSPGSDDQRFVVNDGGVEQCIVYGPGLLDQAHVTDEYVPISEVITATKVMAVSAARLMNSLE